MRPPAPPSALCILWLAGLSLVPPLPTRAGGIGAEVWAGGGVVKASYEDDAMASVKGGVGATFLDRFSLGVSAQADRKREFYTAYAGVVLPDVWILKPYGRFHVGKRDDVDDTALGWTGGVRVGDGRIDLFIEGHGFVDPGYCDGASIGIIF